MQLRAEVPVETGRMSAGIPSAVGVLDPGDFPEAFVVTKEPEEEAALAEGDSFLMVDGPWGPVVVPEEVAVGVEVAGEGAVMEVPLAVAETLEMPEVPMVAGEVKEDVEAAVVEAASVPEEVLMVAVPELVAPLAALEPVAEVRVPEAVPVVEETPVVAVPMVALETDAKVCVPDEKAVEAVSEVVVPLVVSEPEVKEPVPEEAVVSAGEAKEPTEEGRDAVGWRMPEPVAVAPPSRGPRVVMRLMLLVLLVLVGWLAYKAVVLKG
jgi:hypothetical protein